MVDINLLGDDREQQQEGDENSDNFSNTYSSDSRELSSESHYSDPDLDQNLYDKSYTRSSSRKALFTVIAIVCVIATLVVVYYLTKSSENDSITDSSELAIESADEPVVDIPDEMEITEQPVVDVPVFVREMISSTQHGVKTVETILATIPRDVDFTMIQYRDGHFLAEILGKSANNISNLNNQLQQKLTSGNVKVLSRDKRNIMGYTYQQALLNGSFSNISTLSIKQPVYMNPTEIKTEFTQECRQLRLTLKEFEVRNEINTPNYRKTPVMVRAIGNKDAALNFLNRIIEKNINVNLSKIVFIVSDRNLKDRRINLILNIPT